MLLQKAASPWLPQTLRHGTPIFFNFNVHNINLHDNEGKDPVDYARRLANISKLLASDQKHSWDLIGLCECCADRVHWQAPYYEAKEIPCHFTGESSLAATCLCSSLQSSGIWVQQGEVGIIARSTKFERADNNIMVRKLGIKFPKTVRRDVIGIRLKLKESGYILPFFSTHISAFTDHFYTRDVVRIQLDEMITAIRNWWKPGDLVPIVMGDFNSTSWDDDDWAIMKKDFTQMEESIDHNPGAAQIEQIWIGKPESFIGASGTYKIKIGEFLYQYKEPINYSDHGVNWASISGPTSRFLLEVDRKMVHDLDHAMNNCQIPEILGNNRGCACDSLDWALNFGYKNCYSCIG